MQNSSNTTKEKTNAFEESLFANKSINKQIKNKYFLRFLRYVRTCVYGRYAPDSPTPIYTQDPVVKSRIKLIQD